MSERRQRVERVYRDFTPEEEAMFQQAKREDEAMLAELKAEARASLARHEAIHDVLRALRSARMNKGVSLSQVEEASGLGRSVVSRLENHPQANPTLDTLLRYAEAIDVNLDIAVRDKAGKSKSKSKSKSKTKKSDAA